MARKGETITLSVPDSALKEGADPSEPDRHVNQPLLVPGVAASVGIVREASRAGRSTKLTVELGAGLEPVFPQEAEGESEEEAS